MLAGFLGCGQEDSGKPSGGPAKTRGPAAGPAAAADTATREQALMAHLANHADDVDAQLALANLYYDTDRPHRAVPIYLDVLKERPDDADVRTDLGTCYKQMGLLDRARAEYERVAAAHPEHVQATYNLAVVHKLSGDELGAAELWDKVAAMAPGTKIASAATHLAAECRAAVQKSSRSGTQSTPQKESQP